jgi:multicomponent Na+:H+ antiporter subunit E
VSLFLLNLFLALGWAVITGAYGAGNLLLGFGIGYLSLLAVRPIFADGAYFRKLWQGIGLGLFFFYDLVVSSLRVVHDVITPPLYSRPGIIALPLDVETDAEILLLASLITLTPGTLSLDVSEDRKTLFIHAMFIDDDIETLKRGIKDGFERKIIEVMR